MKTGLPTLNSAMMGGAAVAIGLPRGNDQEGTDIVEVLSHLQTAYLIPREVGNKPTMCTLGFLPLKTNTFPRDVLTAQ